MLRRSVMVGLCTLLALGAASETAFASDEINWDDSRMKATSTSLDEVACLSASQTLNVRDQTLSQVLFQVTGLQIVKRVQSFGTDQLEKVINGVTYKYIKVQFTDRAEISNIGWVAENYIRGRSQCAFAVSTPASTQISTATTFPTLKRPTDSYKTGQRRFGASRSSGTRLHAAADLYSTQGDPAVVVAAGKVIRDRYYFYQGTYALEVKLENGKVLRYGEITGKAAPGISEGSSLHPGQTVGYIGTVSSGCCSPMLHFEMYSGSLTGPLTQIGNQYNRRADLTDPTTFLSSLELTRFGVSY